MSIVRCPNPECRHELPAELWTDAPAIICPKCNGIFQKSPPDAPSLPPLIRPIERHSNRWLTLAMAGFFGAGAAVVSAAVLTHYWQRPTTATTVEPFRSIERNFSFVVPGPPWQAMQDYRDREFVVAINMRRADPPARFVLAVRPTPAGYPAVAVAHADAMRFLKRVAGLGHLETAPRPDTELSGVAARRFVFHAALDDDSVSGDVYIVFHQGIAYWLFRWCSAKALDESQPGLDNLRNRLTLLNERPDWRPSPETFRGKTLACSLMGEGSVWQPSAFDPARFDPNADLVLESRPAGAAQVMVLVLPLDGASAIDRARAHVVERQKEEFPDATITESKPMESGIGFAVERQPGSGRWYWLTIAERSGSAVVVQCECALDQRDAWAPEFARLTSTLKLPP